MTDRTEEKTEENKINGGGFEGNSSLLSFCQTITNGINNSLL